MPMHHHMHMHSSSHGGESFKDFNWKSPTGVIIVVSLVVALTCGCCAPVISIGVPIIGALASQLLLK